jgi:DNA-binding transcriptional ArsR family regulator
MDEITNLQFELKLNPINYLRKEDPLRSFGLIANDTQKHLLEKSQKNLRSQITALYLQSNNCIMESRRDVFQAIADPTRRAIIHVIAKQSLNLNAVAEHFDISRPAISKHIKILTECGLITIKQEGRDRYCSIQPKKLAEVADWIEPFRAMWEERFNKVDEILKKLKTKKNEKDRFLSFDDRRVPIVTCPV